MKGRRSFLLITLFISLLMFITGCWESDKTNTPSENQNITLTAITVSPTNPSLNIGETIQFSAIGTYSDNTTQNITNIVNWASSNISVSNVIARGVSSLSGGLASAIASGTTLITATLEGITSPARTLTVSSTIVTNLESITVSPATASISLGAGNSFTAIGAYDDGSTKDITNLVTWISSDEAIATIEAGGYTAPQSVGTTQITATLYGITSIPGTLTVTNPTLTSIDVTPANPSVDLGGTKQFTATATYSNSSTQIITNTVTWASSNEAIATFGVEGLATAQTVGETQITATLDGITSDPQTLSVVASLESIAISPPDPSISLGGTQQLTATGTYYDESAQDLTDTVTWASSNEAVATIGTDGLATAQSIGETQITATLGGVTASAQTLSVCVSSNILMGEIPISDPNQVEDAFNEAVQAVKDAVVGVSFDPQEDSNSINPWMILGEIEMPFKGGSYGTLLEVGAPIFADAAMAMGQHHALGMPCKIGIWTEDSDEDNTDELIKINILSEAVVFSFFFADVMGAEGFDDFAEMIKAQMKGIVQTAVTNLNGNWIYEYQPPFYTQEELTAIQSWVTSGGYAGENGYGISLEIPFVGNKDEGQSDPNFLSEVKNNIMSAIGNTPYARDDWHVINQNFNIPVGDYTDPNNPFADIGEIKLCSAYYAAQVVGMGGKYMVAMPCTVSVWLNDLTMDSQGMPAYQEPNKVVVSILNPEFILQNYFKDIVPLLPATMQEQMANMGAEIKNQLLAMVNNGLKEYSYPNHLFPRLSTNILMGKISIAAEDTPAEAFAAAVQAVKDAVAGYSFVPQEDSNSINPWRVVGEIEMPFSEGSYGTLLEVCAPMFADNAMSMGQHHALGMPCKIGVWTEDSDEDGTDDLIKINTLDESAIFAFYFADVMSAPGFDVFAAMIKTQMKEIVKTAVSDLDGDWIFEHQSPFFTHEELEAIQSWTTSEGGYAGENGFATVLEIPLAGNKDEGQSDVDFLKEIKNNIISMIDIDDDPPYDARADWHVIDPNFIIPVGDYTDPDNPFAAIGEIKLCSPYYAEMIVNMGGQYMVAMPCTISVWLNDLTRDSQGRPIYQTPDKVVIGILNPEFILENFFKDLPEDILEQMAGMGAEIKDQVLAIVDHALTDIKVAPADMHLSIGQTQQFTAIWSYSDSNTKDITNEVTWSSSDESVAVISAEGVATAVSFGETQITAALDGVTSSPQTVKVCISGSILMGQIDISSAEEVEEAFNDAVQAVKDAVDEFTYEPEMIINPINPFWFIVGEIPMPFPEGSYGTLLEVCAPMLADDAMAMGQHHALGMPCKVGIWTEDSDEDGTDDLVKINILNESFIFAVYFADVQEAEGFDQFEAVVKDQMKEIVEAAVTDLGGAWIYEPQAPYYTQEELAALQSWATDGGYAGENGYGMRLEIPIDPNILADPNKGAPEFLSEVKDSIISAIGHTPYASDEWHVIDPNLIDPNFSYTIPVGDYTNPQNPFARIGEIKICSPYYAEQVVGLGGQYMVAMPCTISVWLNDLTMDDQGSYTYQEPNKVIVGILNPEFILQNYFKDIIPTLPASVQEQMADMGTEIKNQVLAMVNFGLKDYSYPNHLYPRVSTNILMGKVTIPADEQQADVFLAAVQAVKNAVDEFVLEDSNSVTPWIVVGEAEMPFPAGSYGTLLEICAPMYADDAMSMGQHHALGMPCKIGVWTEDTDEDGIDDMVNINMLDESVIFAFYFADVPNTPEFANFAAMIKTQTKQMVKAAVTNLDGEWIFEHQPPFFTQEELSDVQSWADAEGGDYAGDNGYGIRLEIPLAWNKNDEEQTMAEFLSEIKDKIISAVGNTPDALSDWHVINEHFNIPVGDPNISFADIGEIKLCSPTYAAQVVGLGGKYMVAMPCTISVWLNDLTVDQAYQEPNKVIVGILNPEFILQNYFKDLPADILEQMAGMGSVIKEEVLAMVHYALEDLYLRGLWESQFETVSSLARAYLAELKDASKSPFMDANTLDPIITNSDIMDDPFILSVRSFEHYQLGHIPEAVNIPWRSLADEDSLLQLPDDDTQILTYCYTGHTGQVAATILNLLGYNAVNLKYGICSWTTNQEIRVAAAFKDPNDSHDFTIETTINPLSELEDYEAPVLNFDAESTQEIALAAASAYLDSGSAPTITAQDLDYLISDENPNNDPFIISVRDPNHYQNPNIGHIRGAYNIPFENIADDENLRKLPTDQQIVTYCYTGHTGQLAATILNMLGYNAVNLKFGMMSWTGNPAVRVVSPFTEGTDSNDFEINTGSTP